MGDLTRNISRHEVACNCGCGYDTIDWELLDIVQKTIEYFEETLKEKVYIKVISGARCPAWNRHEKGSRKSQHMLGRAMDFRLYYLSESGTVIVPPNEVADYLANAYPGRFGVGRYPTFTHFDTRSTNVWRG